MGVLGFRGREALSATLVAVLSAVACQSSKDGGSAAAAGGVDSSAGSPAQSGDTSVGPAGGAPPTSSAGSDSRGGNGNGAGGAAPAGGSGGIGEAGASQVNRGRGGADEGGAPGANAGEGGVASDEDKPESAYIATYLGGVLSVTLDARSGVPTELTGSPSALGAHLYALSVDPSHRFLFTADLDAGRIDTYRIPLLGPLAANAASSLHFDGSPMTLAVDPKGQFLYAGSEDESVHVFSIDQSTGALMAAGDPLVLAAAPAFVALDPSGHFLYLTQAIADGVRGYRVDSDSGALTELAGSPFAGAAVRAGAIVMQPRGAFLFTSGRGLNAFSIDAQTGRLDPVTGSPFSLDVGSDAQASDIAVDARGAFLYATNSVTEHLSGFSIDPQSGVLSPVPGLPSTVSLPYSVAVEPTSRFVYVGGDDGQTSAFAIDPENGGLSRVLGSPFSIGGLQPELAIVPAP